MGLEVIKGEILSSAKLQANSLIAKARESAENLMKETENKVEDIKKKSNKETEKVIDTLKRQETASADLEIKKMILEARKKIIESVFVESEKVLEKLDDKKRGLYIEKLLEKLKKELEPEYFYCNKKDAKFLKGTNIKISEMLGGFIAENKDKTVIVDYSFETILKNIKDSQLQELNKLLFK